MLPYWDETSEGSLQNGIPWALTQENFVLDGETIPNPLRSFIFNQSIRDFINGDNPNYSKLKGYETVRYPLSGLVGSPDDRAATEKHNALYPNYDDNVKLLNQNVIDWLTSSVVVNGQTIPTHVKDKYVNCLMLPTIPFSPTQPPLLNGIQIVTAAFPLSYRWSLHTTISICLRGFRRAECV
jgi:tyrosinase